MKRKINVLGILLDVLPLQEIVPHISEFLDNNRMNTIMLVSARLLVKAGEHEEIKNCIEWADFSLPGNREILEAAGIDLEECRREADNSAFLKWLVAYLNIEHRKVCLLGDSKDSLADQKKYLNQYARGICIEGEVALEQFENADGVSLVNELNSIAPDVILSTLSSPFQEQFLLEHKEMIAAGLWVSLGSEGDYRKTFCRVCKVIRKEIQRIIFKRRVSLYNNDK